MSSEGQETPPVGARGALADPPPAPVRAGVLFVHGIGSQRRGETLTAAGEPLYRWFRDWFRSPSAVRPRASVRLEDTVLLPSSGDPDAPPHTWLKVGPEVELLLAESHWADSFPVPRFSEVARWALLVLPWTIATQFATRLRRILAVYPNRLRYYPLIVLEVLAYLGGFILSGLVEILVLALLVFSIVPIPRFRSYVVMLQLKIASIIGDSYVLLQSPVRQDAIVSRVIRDVRWLAEQDCSTIGLVAHSQGGAIAHRVVRSTTVKARDALSRVKLLFTFGSGLGKLHDIEANSESPNLLWVGWLVLVPIVLATLFTPGVFHMLMTDPQTVRDQPVLQVLVAGLAPMVAIIALVLLGKRIALSRKDLVATGWGVTRPRWVDRHASQDPVPGGPLLDGRDPDIDSYPVFNRHAVWSDHVTYWQNQDGFVTDVAQHLAELAGLGLAVDEPDAEETVARTLREARARRRWRVWWLAGIRTLIGLHTLWAAWLLYRQGSLADLGRVIGRALGPAAPHAERALEASLWPRLWHVHGELALALLAVTVFHVLWYRLGFRVWQWWGRRDLARLFSGGGWDAGGAAFGTLLFVALALPAGSTLLLFGGFETAVGAVLGYLAWPRAAHRAVSIAGVLSILAGGGMAVFLAVDDRRWWRSGAWTRWVLSVAFYAVVAAAINLPLSIWLGFHRPEVVEAQEGVWPAEGLRIAWLASGMLLPLLIMLGLVQLVARPLKRLLERRRLRRGWARSVWALIGLPERCGRWLAEQSVRGRPSSHPEVEPHSTGTALTISMAAATITLAVSYSLYRGWLGGWAVALFAFFALVAALMGWSLRQRLPETSVPYWLAGAGMWLPYVAFILGSILR